MLVLLLLTTLGRRTAQVVLVPIGTAVGNPLIPLTAQQACHC